MTPPHTLDLFAPADTPGEAPLEPLADGAVLLRGQASLVAGELLDALDLVLAASPWRHMTTPWGARMSVAMSNCGDLGWTSDHSGYRYAPLDPLHGQPWPPMPAAFQTLAMTAAEAAGFADFRPDACLINRYAPGTRLSLHQDRNERDFSAPIVSVSLGLPALFQFGGLHRSDRVHRLRLAHGDVVVWGGASRLRYHGVLPLDDGHHPMTGACRINLTFRRAG